MGQFRWDADDAFDPPTGKIKNEHISTTDILELNKTRHLLDFTTRFGLVITGTPVTSEVLVWVAKASGTFTNFECMLTDTGTTTNIDFDVKKNGTTILSSVVNHTQADSDGTVKAGTISTTTFAADDRISIALTMTTNTGAQGPFASIELETVS